MATRKTRQEAEELKAKCQVNHPERAFTIKEIEGFGGAVYFSILEIRKCGDCGAEYTTSAIGEGSLDEPCEACGKQHLAEAQRRTNEKRQAAEHEMAVWSQADERGE